MTHSSRPTLIFNSVISKITPVFSLRPKRRERRPRSGLLSSVKFCYFFPPFFSTTLTSEMRVRKPKNECQFNRERRRRSLWTVERSRGGFGAMSPDVKSPWPHLLTPTVAAPVAPLCHTLLLLTVLSQDRPGQDKERSRWLALSEWGTGHRHIDREGSVSQTASG